jgi:hypothetical protein
MYGPQQKPGAGFPAFNPTAMGLADLSQQAGGKVEVTATLAPDTATTIQAALDGIKPSIPVNVYAPIEVMRDMATLVEMTKISVEPTITATSTALSEFAVTVESQAQINVPVALHARIETLREVEELMSLNPLKVPVDLAGGEGSLALSLAGQMTTQFTTYQNFFYAAGQVPAQSVISGYRGTIASPDSQLVTPDDHRHQHADPRIDGQSRCARRVPRWHSTYSMASRLHSTANHSRPPLSPRAKRWAHI